jgi:predicted flap endonuclease-1-like 5' DNA nuclease
MGLLWFLLTLLIYLLIAGIAFFALGWWLRGRGMNILESKVEILEADLDSRTRTRSELKSRIATIEEDLNASRAELEDARAALLEASDAESELETIHNDLATAKGQAVAAEGRARELSVALGDLESEKAALLAKLKDSQQQAKEAAAQANSAADEEATRELQAELKSAIENLRSERQRAATLKSQLATQKEALVAFGTERSQLKAAAEESRGKVGAAEEKAASANELVQKLTEAERELAETREKLASFADADSRLAASNGARVELESTNRRLKNYAYDLERQVAEHGDLKAEIAKLKAALTKSQNAIPSAKPKSKPAPTPKKKAAIAERIREKAKEIAFDRIGIAADGEKDDLKLIKGIGPSIEEKLNLAGISTFRQIAAFTPEDEDMVNEVIEFFPGRIRRDKWSAQAGKKLEPKPEPKPELQRNVGELQLGE